MAAWLLLMGLICPTLERPITVKNGMIYEGFTVGIQEGVPQGTLVEDLKTILTDASSYLHGAIGIGFGEITILVPETWPDDPNKNYGDAGGVQYSKTDFRIIPGSNSRAATRGVLRCGSVHPSGYIEASHGRITTGNTKNRPASRMFVHEWGHFRFGVFDEYPKNVVEHVSKARCSASKVYDFLDKEDTSQQCTLRSKNCIRILTSANSATSSIMDSQNIPSVHHFCGSPMGNPHNVKAVNKHNRLCRLKSTWDIIQSHPDLIAANPTSSSTVSTVTFRIVRRRSEVIILVLDTSGSMRGDRIRLATQAARSFIDGVSLGTYLGIVSYSGSSRTLASPTNVTDRAIRVKLQNVLPTSVGGSTGIGGGIRRALSDLRDHRGTKQGGIPTGGRLVVITDGAETDRPFVKEVLSEVLNQGVTIDSILMGSSADQELAQVAEETQGSSHFAPDGEPSAVTEAFRSVLESTQITGSRRPVTLHQNTTEVLSSGSLVGMVLVDPSVGEETSFVFEAGGVRPTLGWVIDPNGVVYGITPTTPLPAGEEVRQTAQQLEITIPGRAEVGEWTYKFPNPVARREKLSVFVTSKGVDAITVSLALNATVVAGPGVPVVVTARVTRGGDAVVGATVEARVTLPDGTSERFVLNDEGTSPDVTAGDGVYTRFYYRFRQAGRHPFCVSVTNPNGEARVDPGAGFEVIGEADPTVALVDGFSRENCGGFVLVEGNPERWIIGYPPSSVLDLLAIANHDGSVTCTWTAPGGTLDEGSATRYEFRYSSNVTGLLISFTNGTSVVSPDQIRVGNLSLPKAFGEPERFVFQGLVGEGVEFALGLVAINADGIRSEVSNVAPVVYGPTEAVIEASEGNGLSGGAIAGIVIGSVVFVGVFGGGVYYCITHVIRVSK